MTETQLQRSIADYLSARHIQWHRLNAGSLRGEYKGKPWCVKLAEKGTADILALPTPDEMWIDSGSMPALATCPLYIEVKLPKGKQSPAQIEFQQRVEAMGFRYIVARSIEDVEAAL